MAFLAAMGVFSKRIFAAPFNFITDLVYVPGGSLAGGISMLFLMFGKLLIPKRSTASMMAFTQAVVALGMGMSSFLGLWLLVAYTIPGIVIDVFMALPFLQNLPLRFRAQVGCGLAVMAGAFSTNSAFFRLDFAPMVLFYLIGFCSGAVGGYLAWYAYGRLRHAYPSKQYGGVKA